MRILLLALFPAMLSAQVYVVEAGGVEIEGQTYENATLTYSLGTSEVEIVGFSIAKIEALKDGAEKLNVSYVKNGNTKNKKFTKKVPKVKIKEKKKDKNSE